MAALFHFVRGILEEVRIFASGPAVLERNWNDISAKHGNFRGATFLCGEGLD